MNATTHVSSKETSDSVSSIAVEQVPDNRLDDLSQIIRAYNKVTEKLQVSHESLESQATSLRRELASTNAKLQRSKRLAALGEMAAGIAHEIRNPLGAIQLYAGMLVEDLSAGLQSSQDQSTMLQTARKIAVAVRGLDAIVHDVLNFSRELEPQPVLIRVGDLFDRVIEACRPMIDAADVMVYCRDGQDLHVYADPDLIHQSLLNLVRNAIDAMAGPKQAGREGRPRSELTLDARPYDQQMMLVIRDSGPGIAESEIDRIFNPFFTTRNTGTGLGLAIVHRIIDAHSGTINVHNDGGAVFELSLPVCTEVPMRLEEADANGPCRPSALQWVDGR